MEIKKPEHKEYDNKKPQYGDKKPETPKPETPKPETPKPEPPKPEHKGYGYKKPEEHKKPEHKGYGYNKPEEHKKPEHKGYDRPHDEEEYKKPEEHKGYDRPHDDEEHRPEEHKGYGYDDEEHRPEEHRPEVRFLTFCTFTDSVCQKVTSCTRVRKGVCAKLLDGNSVIVDFTVEPTVAPTFQIFYDDECKSVASTSPASFDQCATSPSTYGFYILYNPWDFDK
jgi:hypothetical protein